MIERTGTWADVVPLSYIKDKAGRAWRVEDARDGQMLLQDREGKRVVVSPNPFDPVTLLGATEDEARATLDAVLGPTTLIGTKEKGQPFRCPPLPHRLEDIHTHLFMLHGIYTRSGPSAKSIQKMLEAHRNDHLQPDTRSHAWVEHSHHKEIK